MQRRRCAAILACMGLLTNGCASYKGQPLPPASSFGFETTSEHGSIRAEALSGAEVNTVFETNPV